MLVADMLIVALVAFVALSAISAKLPTIAPEIVAPNAASTPINAMGEEAK